MTITAFRSEDFLRILILAIPLVIGGILHMVVVSRDILSYFKHPIHQRWFGQNKTWRGFIVMPLTTWPGIVLAQTVEKLMELSSPVLLGQSSLILGLSLGLAYCIAELPNSWMKRRLGIKEGQTSAQNKWIFILIDQSDSAFGCLIAYSFFVSLTLVDIAGTIIFGTVIHLFFNVLLYWLKIRKNPF